MHLNRTPATGPVATHDEADRIRFALAALVVQARRTPAGSPARRVLVSATESLLDALDDLTSARRVTLERAGELAEAAVSAGLASWRADRVFTPGPAVRTWLAELGSPTLVALNTDEADDLARWIDSAPAPSMRSL